MRASLRGLLLIGMRGAGKSAAGRAAAIQTNSAFIDLDERTLLLCGDSSVASVFAGPGGVNRWRDAEREALERLVDATEGPCIVAIGAGAPEHAPTADIIRHARTRGWRIVHVRCPDHVCVARLAADPAGRPSISGAGLLDEITALHATRTPIYESLCDLAVDGDRALADVALSIARAASVS